VVSRVYTDYAVIDITKEGFKVVEINENLSIEYLQTVTEGRVYQ
jgi:acyl CoA:acetate/3-ketoacid CoA transferase beta subunit